jgi:hypothetical protein
LIEITYVSIAHGFVYLPEILATGCMELSFPLFILPTRWHVDVIRCSR